MRVYRLEWEDGLGPYRSEGRRIPNKHIKFSRALREAHDGSINHPEPLFDFQVWMTEGDLCAFTELDALFEWFGDFLDDAIMLGYKIVAYDVEAIVGGYTETRFAEKLRGCW